MNVKLNQLEEKIRNSKCAICGMLLSVGPLMVMSEDGSQIRCGRCKEIQCQTLARYTLYESIAEVLTFPCSFEKCKKMIPWGQVEEHEKVCRFRTVYCPVYHKECSDRIIEVADIQSHFIRAHKDNVQLGSVNFKLSLNSYVILLLVVDNLKFLVYLSTGSRTFLFNVFSLDRLGKFSKYNVKIRSDKNADIVILYLNQKIIQFNETEHCYKCWRKRCRLKYHLGSQAHAKPATFDWQTISHKFAECLENPNDVIITIDLIADQKQQSSGDCTSCQCHKNEDERYEATVDENCEKIDLPC